MVLGKKLRLGRIFVLIVAACCTVEVVLAQSGGPLASTGKGGDAGYVNVREVPYSAVGDGKTDDSQAIRSALDAMGTAGGGIVFVPTGNYRIKTHLVVPAGTSLVGVERAPQLYTAKGAWLNLAGGGRRGRCGRHSVQCSPWSEGITVFYPHQVVAQRPVPYPWTARGGGGGENVSIINVLLVNPYQAVHLATEWSSRHFVRGLYGQPLLKGLWVDKCSDIGRIHDVHFWPFWSLDKRITNFMMANATAFIFQRTDWEVVEDIFRWGYKVGIELSASKDGDMNGQMTDID